MNASWEGKTACTERFEDVRRPLGYTLLPYFWGSIFMLERQAVWHEKSAHPTVWCVNQPIKFNYWLADHSNPPACIPGISLLSCIWNFFFSCLTLTPSVSLVTWWVEGVSEKQQGLMRISTVIKYPNSPLFWCQMKSRTILADTVGNQKQSWVRLNVVLASIR